MQILVIESIIVGLACYLIGHVGFVIATHNNKEEDKEKPPGMNIAFFITGIVIHVLLTYTGFTKLYCNRNCRKSLELLNY